MGRGRAPAAAPALPDLQRRRVRARDVQGPRAHGGRPVRGRRGDDDRRLRDRLRAGLPLRARRVPARASAASRTPSPWPTSAGSSGRTSSRHGFSFDIEIRKGAGAYICGEETAIFGSIEGYRGEPRNKPPFPVVEGLFRQPTVVNNVETLVNVLPIVLEGGPAFAQIGTEKSTGPKLFCVSGAVGTPGTYEVPFGTTLRELLELAGGVTPNLQAVLLGGAAGGFLSPDDLDLRLSIEDAREVRRHPRVGRRGRDRRQRRPRAPADGHRRVHARRELRAVRAVPRRHGPPGGGRRAAAVGPDTRQRSGRARADRRDRPGHARRLDLRPGPDRLVRDRVRHRAIGSRSRHDAAHGQPHDRRPAGRGARRRDDPRGVRAARDRHARRSATARPCSPRTSAASASWRSRAGACSRRRARARSSPTWS